MPAPVDASLATQSGKSFLNTEFVKYLRLYKVRIFVLFVLMAFMTSLKIAYPQFLGFFLDDINADKSNSQLFLWIFLFALTAIVSQLTSTALDYESERFGQRMCNYLRSKLYDRCLRANLDYHSLYGPAYIMERIDGDLKNISTFFSMFLVRVVCNVLLVIVVNVIFFDINLWLGVSFSVFSLVSIVSLYFSRNLATGKFVKEMEMEARYYEFLEERYSGHEDILKAGVLQFTLTRLRRFFVDRVRLRSITQSYASLTLCLSEAIYTVGLLIGISFIVTLTSNKVIGLGEAFLTLQYVSFLFDPIHNLVQQLSRFQDGSATIRRIDTLFKDITLRKNGTRTLGAAAPSIEFFDASFSYGKKQVLKNLSFKIDKGNTVGIIGRSGSGKSTLVRLMAGLLRHHSGQILVDGRPIEEYDHDEMITRIGICNSQPELFADTIRENVRVYNRTISDQAIYRAIETVGLLPWVEQYVQKLDTVVSANNLMMSAGQAQLLMLTRLMVGKKKLLIFDEPLATVSPDEQNRFVRCLIMLSRDATCVIVTHHKAMIKHADEVIVLENGKLAYRCSPMDLYKGDPPVSGHLYNNGHSFG